ncbi:MAG: 50S ribosomal protein L11 methyltransferase [Myxococcota bacterium]
MIELVVSGVDQRWVEALSEKLFAAGAAGLQEDWLPGEAPAPRQPWDTDPAPPEPTHRVIRAWFDAPDRAAIERKVRRYGAVSWAEVEQRDWEAEFRAGFAPIHVTDGWVIAPPWDAPPGALVIEPGQGFGTGLHPSTRMALRLLLGAAPAAGGTALDVGCGSGVLALAAARLGLDAYGIDVEASAVRDAERNAALNHLVARFDATPLEQVPGRFDVVLANLHAELLLSLRAPLLDHTGLWLVQAGILADREAAVREAYAPALTLAGREVEGEWVALAWRRP